MAAMLDGRNNTNSLLWEKKNFMQKYFIVPAKGIAVAFKLSCTKGLRHESCTASVKLYRRFIRQTQHSPRRSKVVETPIDLKKRQRQSLWRQSRVSRHEKRQ